MQSPSKTCLGLLLCSITLFSENVPADVVFPSDSKVINVRTDLTIDRNSSLAGTQSIYSVNCAGNGTTDDTLAIRAAIAWALSTTRGCWPSDPKGKWRSGTAAD